MQTLKMQVRRLNSKASLPFYASREAAGLDLSACLDAPLEIAPNERVLVSTGLAMAIPKGHVGLVFSRSSLGFKLGLSMPNSVGVIDSDYRGEMRVALVNISGETRVIEPGMRIGQLVLVPIPRVEIEECEELSETERGSGGFGSTGA